MGKLLGWMTPALAVLAMACGGSGDELRGPQRSQQALMPGELFLYTWAPDDAYVGISSVVSTTIGYMPFEPTGSVDDVKVTTTVTGAFDFGSLNVFTGLLGCAQAPAPGGVTVTCTAASLPAPTKDGFDIQLTPTAEGTISIASSLEVGGSLVDSLSRTMNVHADAQVDLATEVWGGGTLFVNQSSYASVLAANWGPVPATGVKVALTLAGPGKLDFVQVPWWAGSGTCTWTDSTAECDVGDLFPWAGVPIELMLQGTSVGQLTLTSTISGNEEDAASWNNQATGWYDVIQPKLADLALTMTDAPDPAAFKKPLTYTLTVKNNGPDAASGAMVDDWLPSTVTFVSATPSQGACFGGDWGWLSCDLGALGSGAFATVKVVVIPNEGGTLANSAWVQNPASWYELDPNWENNQATAITTVKGPNPPVQTQARSERFPASIAAWVECANDFVWLEGSLHSSSHSLYNKKSGMYQYEWLANPQGISGQGMTSGDTYHATGMTRGAEKWSQGFPKSFDYQNNFRIIGEKTGNNLLVHAVTHVTFNADGSYKSEVTKYSFECK